MERALAHLLGTPGIQADLLEAVVRFGSPMVDRLIDQLHSDDADARKAAVAALGRIGDAKAVEPLIALLDEDDALRVPAASALARLGDRRAFEPLIGLIGDPDLSSVRLRSAR